MKNICRAIKKVLGIKPKKVKVPVNNFEQWTSFEKSVAAGINLIREENKPISIAARITGNNKLSNLTPDQLLYEEAIKRCEVQFDRDIISHDGVGEAFQVMTDAGFKGHAEILAYGYSTPDSVVTAWFNSESHRRIMLKTSHKYFGVAMREHNKRKYYCVLFAR